MLRLFNFGYAIKIQELHFRGQQFRSSRCAK